MIHNSFAGNTGFTVEGGLKDANHLRHLAASVHTTIPVIDLAHNSLITSWAAGGKEKDWSSLVAGPRVAAGLGGFTGVSLFHFLSLKLQPLPFPSYLIIVRIGVGSGWYQKRREES